MAARTLFLAAAALAIAAPASADDKKSPPVSVPVPVTKSTPVLVPAPTSPAPPPVVVRAPLPQKWEDVPAATQAVLQKRVKPLRFQPVVKIGPANDIGVPRTVETGELVAIQTVEPAKGVKLTSAPRREQYGVVGTQLHLVKDGTQDFWCRYMTKGFIANHYCFVDRDGDGWFEQLFEYSVYQTGLSFQSVTLGKDEKLGKPVSYAPAEAPALKEIVAIRFAGVHEGMIAPDGFVKPGVVKFELIVGESARSLIVAQSYEVRLDRDGRGEMTLPTGHKVSVAKVEVGGRAEVTVHYAVDTDQPYVYPEMTPQRVLDLTRRASR